MKNRKLTSALVATGLLFPIAAFGQTTGTGQTGQQDRDRQQQRDQQTTMGQTATQTQRDQQRQTGAAGTTGTHQAGATATTGTTQQRDTLGTTQQRDTFGTTGLTASASTAQIRRVERDELDNRPTANNLTGKNVVGSDGERIGTVHDIGLSAVLPSDLQQVQDQGMFGRDTGTAQTTGTTRAGGDTTRTAQAQVGDRTYSATLQTDALGQQGMDNEVTIYVSVGGVLGLGANIVSIPASQFTYDSENDELRLNQPSAEIERIADGEAGTQRATGAAE